MKKGDLVGNRPNLMYHIILYNMYCIYILFRLYLMLKIYDISKIVLY